MFRGYHNGIPIFDYVEDIPDDMIQTKAPFYVVNVPEDNLRERAIIGTYDSPLWWYAVWLLIKIGVIVVALYIVAQYVVLPIINGTGHLLYGFPAQKVDENVIDDGKGNILIRDPETGEWTLHGTGTLVDMIPWIAGGALAIAAFGVIGYLIVKGGD